MRKARAYIWLKGVRGVHAQSKNMYGILQGRVCRAAHGMREAGDTHRRGISNEESRMEERSVKAERGVRGR